MTMWALLLYYIVFYAWPWDGKQLGYQWVHANAPGHFPGPPETAFPLAMALGFAACLLVSVSGWLLLARDDKRWVGARGSIGGAGWLLPLDLVIPCFLFVSVAYAVWKEVPLHGMLAAVVPAAVVFWLSAQAPKVAPAAVEVSEEEEPAKPPMLAEIPYEPMVEAARRHAGAFTPRDTVSHSAVFAPPALDVSPLANPDPYAVSWIVPRDEHEAALKEAPEQPFSGLRPSALVRAVQQGAGERGVAFLAERIGGPGDGSPEDRISRLSAFVRDHLEEMPSDGRSRLPLACLAERRASGDEATVLVSSMALSLGIPIALWTAGEAFGLAIEGIPANNPILTGREQFDPTTKRRYVLIGASGDARIYPLAAPYRRTP